MTLPVPPSSLPPQAAPPYPVTHVFFDVDGTLVDLVGAVRAAADGAAEALGAERGRPLPTRTLWETRAAVSAELPALGFEDLWGEVFLRLLRDDPAPGDPAAAAARVLAVYRAARRRALQPYPDVAPALEALRAGGLQLVAASNGWVDLADLGLHGLFAGTHYARDVGVAKPDPAFYRGALARAGVAPQRALMVGDRVDNDYLPARAVGMWALWLDRGAGDAAGVLPARPGRQADTARITSLAEVPGLVAPLPPPGGSA